MWELFNRDCLINSSQDEWAERPTQMALLTEPQPAGVCRAVRNSLLCSAPKRRDYEVPPEAILRVALEG